MKRMLILFATVLLLSACGSSDEKPEAAEPEIEEIEQAEEQEKQEEQKGIELSDEVSGFVEKFNELASLSEDVKAIDDIEEAVEIEDGSTQVLYSSLDYGIVAIYNDDGSLSSYSIPISKNEPYEELQGKGLNAMLHIGAALGLDLDNLGDEFEKALAKESHISFGDDYTIMYFNHKLSGKPTWGMVVEFMKK